jgi:prolyl oligopeptidase
MPMDRRTLLGSTVALALAGVPRLASAQVPSPPRARVAPVTDTYFGTPVVDPYRWMEAEDAEWTAYAKAQGAYTAGLLGSIPGRSPLVEALNRSLGRTEMVVDLQAAGGRLFSLRLPADADALRIHVRDNPEAKDRLLLDPVKLGGEHASIDFWQASYDGRHLLFGYAVGGTEESIARIMEVDTGRLLPEAIDRTTLARPSWSPDHSGFFYTRLKAGAPPNGPEKLKHTSCWFHRLDTDASQDVLVMGPGYDPTLPLGETRRPGVIATPGSDLVLGRVVVGIQDQMELHLATLAEAKAGKPRWRKVCDASDHVVSAAVVGRDIYLLSYHGAPRGRVLKVSADRPAIADAQEVLAQSDAVLRWLSPARDGVYVNGLDAGLGALWRIGAGDKVVRVKTPIAGSLSLFATDPGVDGVWTVMEGWVSPPKAFRVDAGGQSHPSDLTPASAIDVSAYTSEEVMVASHDGVRVPLSIIYRKDLKRDGSAPLIIEAYGAYGMSNTPSFDSLKLPFLALGGVYAVAHVRGGGELGEGWHKAGQKLTKPNTWRDLIACAEHLIAQRYTSSARLGVLGGSAGGITVGRFMTERPELAAVVISIVGLSNPLRAEVTPGGPANFPEFGTPKEPDGFKALLEMDAYLHVRDGVPYPATLLMTGLNDPRVPSWQVTKMLARLQAATSSGKPVLLRLDPDAGHNAGGREQAIQSTADIYTFMLWNTGQPGFTAPTA